MLPIHQQRCFMLDFCKLQYIPYYTFRCCQAPLARPICRSFAASIARAYLDFVCVIDLETSDNHDSSNCSLTHYTYSAQTSSSQQSTSATPVNMPDSPSESRPLISPSAQSQPRPLGHTVDKRKQDKSVIKSSLDIVFSCEYRHVRVVSMRACRV